MQYAGGGRHAGHLSDDPRCLQFREPGDSGWLLSHCFKVRRRRGRSRHSSSPWTCLAVLQAALERVLLPADEVGLTQRALLSFSQVIMMQAGFAVVESSFVRQKNSANIMMKNVADLCVGALGFWACGWALAYGVDTKNPANINPFCGTGEWFMIEGYDYSMVWEREAYTRARAQTHTHTSTQKADRQSTHMQEGRQAETEIETESDTSPETRNSSGCFSSRLQQRPPPSTRARLPNE